MDLLPYLEYGLAGLALGLVVIVFYHLKEHERECSEIQREVYSLLREVREDLALVKGRLIQYLEDHSKRGD